MNTTFEQQFEPAASKPLFSAWIYAVYLAALFVFLGANLAGKDRRVPTDRMGEGIWSMETYANSARLIGSAHKGDRLLFQAAGQTNFWECTFPQQTIFIASFFAGPRGLKCNVTTAQRDVLLALTNCWPGESSRASDCHFQCDGIRQGKSSQAGELVEIGYWQRQSGTRAPIYADFFFIFARQISSLPEWTRVPLSSINLESLAAGWFSALKS